MIESMTVTEQNSMVKDCWLKAIGNRNGQSGTWGFPQYDFGYLIWNTVTKNRDSRGGCAYALVSFGIPELEERTK